MQPHHVLVLPDIHVPYHDQGVIDAVLRYAKDQTWEQCVILGDFMDFDVLSSFNRGLLRPNEGKRLRDDYVAGNKLLDQIQAAARHKNPACKIVLLEGNHEYRTERFVDEFAMFEGLLDVEAHLRLAERDIEYVRCCAEGQLYRIGHAYFHHGQAVNKNHPKTMVERFGVNIFYGHCFDDQTELLTPQGWKSRKALNVGDEVMTYNLATGKLEPNAIQATYDYPAAQFPQLVKITGQNVDLLVTEGHGLVDIGPKRPDLYRAGDFGDRATRTFACAAPTAQQDYDIADDWLRLAVWVAADGELVNPKYRTQAVRFRLKKERKIRRLRELLGRLGLDSTESIRKADGVLQIYVPVPDSPLSSLFRWDSKRLPAEFMGLSARQGQILIEEYAETDGCRTGPNSIQISTAKADEADLLQSIAIQSGWRCNKTRQQSGFVLSLNSRATSQLRREAAELVPNHGTDVWCVSVPNGTLVARRGGKVCVTQNTHDVQSHAMSRWGHDNTIVGQSLGCLCKYDQAYMKGRPSNWQHAFADFWFWPDGTFQYHVTSIFDGKFFGPNGKGYTRS